VQLQRLRAYHEKQQTGRNAAGRKLAVAPIATGLRQDGQSYAAVLEGKAQCENRLKLKAPMFPDTCKRAHVCLHAAISLQGDDTLEGSALAVLGSKPSAGYGGDAVRDGRPILWQ
jgi:hypothetical protein